MIAGGDMVGGIFHLWWDEGGAVQVHNWTVIVKCLELSDWLSCSYDLAFTVSIEILYLRNGWIA